MTSGLKLPDIAKPVDKTKPQPQSQTLNPSRSAIDIKKPKLNHVEESQANLSDNSDFQPDGGDMWIEINNYRALQAEADKFTKRQKFLTDRSEMQKTLQEQIKHRRQKEKEEKLLKQKYDSLIIKEDEENRRKERMRKQDVKSKINLQKIQIDSQIKMVNERKKKEQKEQREYERKLLNDIQEDLEAENRRKVEKRRETLEQYERIKELNEREKILAAERREKERQEDIKAMEEMARQAQLQDE